MFGLTPCLEEKIMAVLFNGGRKCIGNPMLLPKNGIHMICPKMVQMTS